MAFVNRIVLQLSVDVFLLKIIKNPRIERTVWAAIAQGCSPIQGYAGSLHTN